MKRAIFILIALVLAPQPAWSKVLHKERSLYRNILVTQEDGLRCLVFTVRRDSHSQSCQYLDHPKRMVFAYVRMVMGGLLLDPHPHHILVVGLGGGTIPTTFSEIYPDADIDVVEIDPAVLRVARKYFNFHETPKMKVTLSDGRVFVKRARLASETYDLVVLDAFNGDYIPEHLMTKEFLEEVKSILTDGGVLVANTFSSSALYDHESQTYKGVYGKFFNFRLPVSGNRVVIARKGKLPDDVTLGKRAAALEPLLAPYDVDIKTFAPHMRRDEDWDHSRRMLTDQYSPANLLRGEH
ncbi:MAG TPA: fused MFS/spermidine synthase [Pseudomonadales bacterium]|nr:fused MFS/spermidine synthase [Pseudomonadales bacterium]